ncbi:50S ribosomal protein L25/general stress protein Ctc [Timonella senegalensis]|uniref:50S ribosomal protein L25/general stress protein Ctc n=1 Tax=Timonella senegalensis TaxID=1465825 RepID=UPI0028A74ED8|nr:50S ribosomal protein L25/general stress protein Ctc [Timonella senegalensis]
MSAVKFVASARTNFGKGAARQARRDGNVPAVIYSHGSEAVHVLVDAHEIFLAVKNHRTSLLEIELDGETKTAIFKDIQRDAIGRVIEHVDFLAVKKGEKQVVDVPVNMVGESASGTQATLELLTASVEADVSALPEHVEVNIAGLEAGTVLHVKDVTLPEGQTWITDSENVVLVVNEIAAVEEETEEAPAAAEAPAAE